MKVFCTAILDNQIISNLSPNYIQIDKEEMKKLSKTAKGKSVLYKGNMCGTIVNAFFEDGKLELIIEIKKKCLE